MVVGRSGIRRRFEVLERHLDERLRRMVASRARDVGPSGGVDGLDSVATVTASACARNGRPGLATAVPAAMLGLWLWSFTPPALGAEARPSSGDMARCIRDPHCRAAFVVAHRGRGAGAPENSRAAVRAHVEVGTPVIEIDLRASRDGHLFVFHDSSLDRLTSRSGRLEDRLAAELDGIRLENHETIPRFADLYRIARGRAILSLDFKSKLVREAADWIVRHGSFDDVIFYLNTDDKLFAAARIKARHPSMMLMTSIRSLADLDRRERIFGMMPEIVHVSDPRSPEARGSRTRGVKIYASRLTAERWWWPLRYFAIMRFPIRDVDFIETGDPVSVSSYLEASGRAFGRSDRTK